MAKSSYRSSVPLNDPSRRLPIEGLPQEDVPVSIKVVRGENPHDRHDNESAVIDAQIPIEMLPAFGFTFSPEIVVYDGVGRREGLVHHPDPKDSGTCVPNRNDDGIEIHHVRLTPKQMAAVKSPEDMPRPVRYVMLSDVLRYLREHHTDEGREEIRDGLNRLLSR